jgi:hypothetical protein
MTRRAGKRFVGAALVAAFIAMPATSAEAGTRYNQAVAYTNGRDRVDVSVSFRIAYDHGPIVTANNFAFARGSYCTGCRTVAIALQIDLVSGPVTKVNATNVSLAKNVKCVRCDTVADAHQFVVAPGTEDVGFTQQGSSQLRAIKRELIADAWKAQPGAQLQAEINALIARVESVLRTQLVSEKPDNDPERSTHLASRSPHVDHRAGVSHATQPDEERAG